MAFTPYPEFSDQVVVITGGSRGIGFATACRFLKRGARVGICALDPERLAEAARALGGLGEVEAVMIDVRSMEQIQRFVSQVYLEADWQKIIYICKG